MDKNLHRNDGQPALRASIARELQAAGTEQAEAEARATQALLALRQLGAGQRELHVGNTVIVVNVKEE